MHRRMPKKMVMSVMVLAVALLFLTTGCAGKTKGKGEDLVCLTDAKLQEVPEEEENQDTKDTGNVEDTNDGMPGNSEISQNSGIIYVHVCGQVVNPGVYPLPAGSRLYEAIEAAGGILESGAGEQLNQAAQVGDGQQVYVPSKEEAQQGLTGGILAAGQGESGGLAQQGMAGSQYTAGQVSPEEGNKVNLNTASREQLMTLSGIGEAKAASIIAYREEHGGFQKIEELMEVEGIKEGVFNKVKDRISIN